jgi:hypothetical protein
MENKDPKKSLGHKTYVPFTQRTINSGDIIRQKGLGYGHAKLWACN